MATVPVRDAASLVITERSAGGVRYLLGKRRSTQQFAPDKYVFPGGAIDAADVALATQAHLIDGALNRREHARLAHAVAADAPTPEAIALAALRETFEETGLLVGTRLQTVLSGSAPTDWQPYFDQRVKPRLPPLTVLGRAITPDGSPRRFDARFLHVWADETHGETGAGDGEFERLDWMSLAQALDSDLHDVTRAILQRLEPRLTATRDLRDAANVPFFYNVDGAWVEDHLAG